MVAFALLMFLRRPDAFLNPQFWAEDAVVFHDQAVQSGWGSLARSSAGYLHTLPRLVALPVCRWVDAAIQPAAFNYAAVAIAALVLAQLGTERWSGPSPVMLAVAVVLAPQAGEILANLTNVQWITALGLVFAALVPPPASGPGKALEASALFLVALTGPFAVALAPLFLVRCWRFGAGAGWSAALVILADAIQMLAFQRAILPPPPALALQQHSWAEILGLRLFAQQFAPIDLTTLSGSLLVAIACVGVGVISLAALYPGGNRAIRTSLLAAAALLELAVVYRMNGERDVLMGAGNGPRYFFDARILLVWLVLVTAFTQDLPRWLRAVAAVFVAGALAVGVADFRIPPLPDLHWRAHADSIRQGRPADIPVNPVPYIYHYRGRPLPRP